MFSENALKRSNCRAQKLNLMEKLPYESKRY